MGISEVQQGEMQSSSEEMIFGVTVDAKLNMSQEIVRTGNKRQLFLIMEYYGVLCGGKTSLVIVKSTNTFHLLPPSMQKSRWLYCLIILF